MKIGILSDTHDQAVNIQQALQIFQEHQVKKLFHCGDVTTLASVQWFCEFPLALAFGNGDTMTGEIKAFLRGCNVENTAVYTYEGEYLGKRIGMTHSHLAGELKRLIDSQTYDYVFYGHTHLRSDERMGRTRVINPGSLGGLKKQSRSVCILDLEKDEAVFEETI
jgi:putative phosphoesterase